MVPDEGQVGFIGNTSEAKRPALETLSESRNKVLAVEAQEVFDELSGREYKGGGTITDPGIVEFVNKALANNEYGFQEKLAHGQEVRFSNNHFGGKNFSFYGTRTITAKTIAARNATRPPIEKQAEENMRQSFQRGMLTIQKFGDKDIRISVSDTQSGRMKGLSLVA